MKKLSPFFLGLLTTASLGACSQASENFESAGAGLSMSSGALVGIGGKCLDVDGLRTDPDAKLQIWQCWGGDNQKWMLDGNAIVGIGGKCLEVAPGGLANGSRVHIADCNGSAQQHWSFTNGGAVVGIGGRCLDVDGLAIADGTIVQLWDCWGGDNQKWTFAGKLPPPSPTGEEAKMADTLVETLGANSHLGWGGSPYDTGFETVVVPTVTKLGLRHLRDGAVAGPGWPATRYTRLAERVHTANGAALSFDLNTDPSNCSTYAADISASVEYLGAALIDSFEAPNEMDNAGTGHKCPWTSNNWVNEVRTYQQNLWNAVRGNPAVASKWVFGPSLTQAPGTAQQLGDLSAFMTHGNMHSYPGNGQPANQDSERDKLRAMNGDRPVVATETGYHTWPQTSSGFRGVSERAEGKYAPRLLANYFNSGVGRVYFYELIDDNIATWSDIEQHFGLVHADGSPKPAFSALANLVSVTSDPGASFAPGKLDYALANAPSDLRHTLLEKRDGSFQLLLWREVSSYDGNANGDIMNSTFSVNVTLRSAARVRWFAPATSATVTRTENSVASASIDVGDDIVVLDIMP